MVPVNAKVPRVLENLGKTDFTSAMLGTDDSTILFANSTICEFDNRRQVSEWI